MKRRWNEPRFRRYDVGVRTHLENLPAAINRNRGQNDQGNDRSDIGERAAETASNLYRGGRELLAGNEDLSKAADNLSAAVRKNPLAAVGIAFSAGLLLALLTRG